MTHDFIFINNGKPIDIYSFQGTREIFLWTKDELNGKTAIQIEKICPKILLGNFTWSSNLLGNYLFYEEDEIMLYYIEKLKLGYDIDNKTLTEIYTGFAADIENFALEANKIAPLYLFIGIDRITGSNWDKWSISQINEILDKISSETGKSQTKDSLLKLALELLYQRYDLDAALKQKIKKMIGI